jgi:YHS domain-containing protein
MFRFILVLLASILLISLLRSIVGVVLRGFADLVGGADAANSAQTTRPRAEVPVTGELKKDPVCGTFVATSSSVKKTIGGQVLHFCSNTCRDKYSG